MYRERAEMTGGKRLDPCKQSAIGRILGWVLSRMARKAPSEERLRLVHRIALSPRQSITLVEVEGRRLLLATGSEGAPAFYALDGFAARGSNRVRGSVDRRISW
jgi:hypothetical protein